MKGSRFDIPSVSTLVAFEAIARLGSVKQAAAELNTSSPAISRHLRHLETKLRVKLFERRNRGVVLTKDGKDYHDTVRSALEILHVAGCRRRVRRGTLTIACTQEVSALLLRPVLPRLKPSLPDRLGLRILICDDDTLRQVMPLGVDIVLQHSVTRPDDDSTRILAERVVPVASPALLKQFEGELSDHPRHWTDVPRLDVASRSQGWATWASWFAARGCEPPPARVETFESYVELLEAATNGDGMALGWDGFVGGHLETGKLVPLWHEWTASEVGLHATLTSHGRRNPNAGGCIRQLAILSRELSDDMESNACNAGA